MMLGLSCLFGVYLAIKNVWEIWAAVLWRSCDPTVVHLVVQLPLLPDLRSLGCKKHMSPAQLSVAIIPQFSQLGKRSLQPCIPSEQRQISYIPLVDSI